MPAGPTLHHGHHDFRFGELRFARVHVYPSLAALNADAAYAVARLVYVIENQTYYIGKPGAWVELGTGGGGAGGGGGGAVSDPADLDHQYPNVVGSVLAVDVALSQFTLDIPTPGDLDHLQAGDALTISGSADSGAVNWLDGSYDILAVDPLTGVVDVVPGTIPPIPNPPEVTFGNYAAIDQTFPTDGQLAVVNPDPDTGEPAIWIYDAGDAAWYNANTLDNRQLFRDGSRTATGWISLDALLTSLPPTLQALVTRNYVEAVVLGYSTGRHVITSIASAGTTVVTFNTTDETAVTGSVGHQLVIAGTATAADGSHTITAASWLLGVATVTIADTGVNAAAPPGTVAIQVPGAALADSADVAAVAASLAAHIAALDPHPQYTTTAEADAAAAAAVATHVANPDPHPALPTVGETTAIADNAVAAHDNDLNAHGGVLAAAQAAAGGGVVAQNQPVSAGLEFGEPVVQGADGRWISRSSELERPQGLVVRLSTVISGIYASISVEAVAPNIVEVPPAVAERFIVGRFYQFGGLALNDWVRVTAVDTNTGELTVEPTVVAEGPASGSVNEMLSDGAIAVGGLIPLNNGNSISPQYDVTEFSVLTSRVRLGSTDLQLAPLLAGTELLLAGTTGNNGSFPIESIDVTTRDVFLRPAKLKSIFTENVESIVVATRTIEFDAGADLSELVSGDRLVLATTTDNNGVFTLVDIDDTLKTVTVAEPLPGTDQAAPAGTGQIYAVNRLSPLTNNYPVEVTYLTGSIQSIDVDDGSGQAVIVFDAGDDLSTILPGDEIEITGATDPLNNVVGYSVFSADNGTKELRLTSILPGADQGAPAGTGVVTGFHPGVDGTGEVRRPDSGANYPFDNPVAAHPGPIFYGDIADAAGASKTPKRFSIGNQVSTDVFLVDIEAVPSIPVQEFSGNGTILSGKRMVVIVDATAAPVTLDLPAGNDDDELHVLETSGVNGVTLDADGAETVNGAGTDAIGTGTGRHYYFKSGNWYRLTA